MFEEGDYYFLHFLSTFSRLETVVQTSWTGWVSGPGGGGCYMHVAVIRVTFIVIAILHSFIIDIGTISHYAILIVTFIMTSFSRMFLSDGGDRCPSAGKMNLRLLAVRVDRD